MNNFESVFTYTVPGYELKCENCEAVICDEHYIGHNCKVHYISIQVDSGRNEKQFHEKRLCQDCHNAFYRGDLQLTI